MPGILGIVDSKEPIHEQATHLAGMAYPLVFSPDQEVMWFRHGWYCAGTVGYGDSFSFLKKSSAYKEGVLLIMDGEVFPDARDVPGEFADRTPTIQRAEYCLHLYLQYGSSFVRRLNGTFAIALLDSRDHSVHLYTDRFGSEPIFIWTQGGKFVFATSQRSLLAYRDEVGREYDRDAIAELIVFEKILGDKTLFRDICRMRAASHVTWDGKQCSTDRYWELTISRETKAVGNWKDAAVELNRRLERSVAKRLGDGARSGALVSGGSDSRLLLCFCPSSTIAATFSNRNHPPSVDTRIASRYARMLGHDHVLLERDIDHYASVAQLSVDVNESQTTFAGCHSLGLHQQMLDAGIRVVLTAYWWDVLFKGYYSMGAVAEQVYRDEPGILKCRRIAGHLSNAGAIRKLHHQHLMVLALSSEMKERAAIVKERVTGELFHLLSEEGEPENLPECFTWRDLQSRAGIGFHRALQTRFPDRSPAYDNDLWMLGTQIPLAWKKGGRIVRRALCLANRRVAWITDANTGLPAALCPPWSTVLDATRRATRGTARWLSHYSKTVAGYREPLPGCRVFVQNDSWHDRDGTLRLCQRYRSMVEHTIERLDGTMFDKGTIAMLLRDDLRAPAPRLHKLFEILLTFGLFDEKWGPSAERDRVSGEIAHMSITDLQ